MEHLIKQLSKYQVLSTREQQIILSKFEKAKLKKDDYFLEAGKYCSKIAFVNKGILRIFFREADGEEVTRYFLAEGKFAVDLEAFNNHTVAKESYQAVTTCELLLIYKSDFIDLMENLHIWPKIVSSITEEALLEKMIYRSRLVHQDAKTKYLNFIKNNYTIANRIPLKFLASYLGIKQQSLSRIRKELTNP